MRMLMSSHIPLQAQVTFFINEVVVYRYALLDPINEK